MPKKQIKTTSASSRRELPLLQKRKIASKLSLSQDQKRASHHDIFFKSIYAKLDFALELFKLIFNKKEMSACDWKHLKVEKDALKEKRADLVLSVPLKSQPKTKVKIFFLLEHKSYYDPKTLSQMLYYQTILHEENLQSDSIVLIIPVLFYHGKTPWKWAKSFQEEVYKGFLSKIPAGFRKNMINYKIRLLDTNKLKGVFENKSFKSRGAFYLMQKIWGLKLTHAQLKDVMSRFGEFSGDKNDKLMVSVTDYLQSFFKMSKKFKKLWQQVEKELVEEGIFKRRGYMDIVKHIKERGHVEGLRKGVKQGEKKGEKKGRKKERQELILSMLKEKLDIAVVSRVTGLSAKEIKKFKNGA